jgi:hypothetical protein
VLKIALAEPLEMAPAVTTAVAGDSATVSH